MQLPVTQILEHQMMESRANIAAAVVHFRPCDYPDIRLQELIKITTNRTQNSRP